MNNKEFEISEHQINHFERANVLVLFDKMAFSFYLHLFFILSKILRNPDFGMLNNAFGVFLTQSYLSCFIE